MFLRYLVHSPIAVLGFLVALIGGGLFAKAGMETADLARVTKVLSEGDGTVVALAATPPKGTSSMRVEFAEPSGAKHRAEFSIDHDTWMRFRQGDRVALYISGVDPSRAWRKEAGTPGARDTLLGWTLGAASFIAGVVLFWIEVRQVRRRIRTLLAGSPAPGAICELKADSETPYWTYTLRYTWKVGGQEYCAKAPALAKGDLLKLQKLDPLLVYVDPADPANGEVDCFGYRAWLDAASAPPPAAKVA